VAGEENSRSGDGEFRTATDTLAGRLLLEDVWCEPKPINRGGKDVE